MLETCSHNLLSLYGGSEEIAIVMQQIGSVLEGRPRTTEQLSTGISEANTADNCQLTERQINRVLDEYSDLVTRKFRGWHRGHIKRLGIDRYRGLAADARRGRHPKKLFSYLLKETV